MSALRGFQVAALAAVLWVVFGLESILRPYPILARDAVWYIPFVVMTVALWYVHRAQARARSTVETAGYIAVMVSCALVMVGNVGVLFEIPSLALFAFPWGAILWTLAMIPFGIGTARAGVFPRFVGISLALLEPGSMLTGLLLAPIAPLQSRGCYSGGVEKGLVMAVVSMGFLARMRTPRYNP